MFSKPKDMVLVSPREDVAGATIHMCFMLCPIGVVWLDSNFIVVDLATRIMPFSPLKPKTWRVYRPKKSAKYVIELGVGNVGDTAIGDKIEFMKA